MCLSVFSSNHSRAEQDDTPIIAAFVGLWGANWDTERFRSDTPFDKANRIHIAFGKLIQDSNNHFTVGIDGDPQRVNKLITRIRQVNPTADIFLTVGGDGDSTSYGGAAVDSQFAQNVMTVLKSFGFNGYDINWENSIDKNGLNNLVTNMYSLFHPNGYKLTLDVWPFPNSEYDMTVLQKNLDQMNIMSYGRGRTLQSSATAYIQAGFPANKLIGGIETEREYREAGGPDTLGENGTIANKAAYARSNGMAGMMSWVMTNDHTTVERPNYPTYQGALQLWSSMTAASPPPPPPPQDDDCRCALI